MDGEAELLEILREHWVLALATRDPEDASREPYSTPLFYALVDEERLPGCGAPVLVFAGKESSAHGRHLGLGPTRASAAVFLETETVGQIRGVQLRGHVVQAAACARRAASAFRAAYLTRHPVAAPLLLLPGETLYAFVISWAKVTDNRFGFGVRKVVEFAPDWSVLGCDPPDAEPAR
ncbi:MAG: hypothetical protein HY812_03555 [Planctomycetes bacterium]|nr:hypothetical protein [Planctomycetota bacterium]